MMRSIALACALVLAQPCLAEQSPRLRPLDFAQAGASALAPGRQAEILALLQTASIADLQGLMAEGKLTSVELTQFYLTRIEALDEGLRSYLEINPQALDEAKAADAARAKGETGAMLGIPVSLKDNIETAAPLHTTANAAILLDNIAAADAPLVVGLHKAGAVILGKTSLSEFAGVISRGSPEGGSGAVGGQGVNPHGAAFPVFGSSSGSAISTAALLTQVSVGSETSGSLIAPSMINGVVALKPSKGLVSGEGVIPLVSNNDTAGPIGRSVADVAALLAVIDTADTDYSAGLSITALDGVTVGVLAAGIAGDRQKNGGILPAASAILTALGARLRPTDLTDPSGVIAAFAILIGSGMRYDMMPYITARHPELVTLEDLAAYNAADPTRMPFGQDLLTLLAGLSAKVGPKDHLDLAKQMTEAATASLERAFAATGAEVLLSVGSAHSTTYASAGYPAVTVPMGLRPDGAPWGVTLIGKKGQDARLLGFAYAFEQATLARVTPALALP